jgi:hypothetical protein
MRFGVLFMSLSPDARPGTIDVVSVELVASRAVPPFRQPMATSSPLDKP